MKKPGKLSVRRAVEACGGVVADVAEHFKVSRTTVYKWLDEYDLRGSLASARADMREVAEDNIYKAILDGDVGVSQWALERLDKPRWSKQTQVTGADGGALFDGEILALMRTMGINADDVVREFEAMVRAAAVEKGRV